MPFKRYLTEDEIDALYEAAVRLGLAGARGTLLVGIPEDFTMGLEIAANPGAQLRSDLLKMNGVEALADEERTIPLQRWLKTAYQLHKIRSEARVFKEAIDKIARAPGEQLAVPVPAPVPAPVKPWGVTLSGPELRELCDALLRAFPKRDALAMMLKFGLDLRLDGIAPSDNLRATVFALVEHTEAHGLTRRLFDAAIAEAPGNPDLRALAPRRGS